MSHILTFCFTFLLSLSTLAHESGHGPTVEGYGPNGGKLTAVVAARDVDKGAKATVQGHAEWRIEGQTVKVSLFDAAHEKPLNIGPGELKWILLFKDGAKPTVEKINRQKTSSETEMTFPAELLDRIKTIECILPSFNGVAEKHMFAIGLEMPSAQAPSTTSKKSPSK